MKIFKCKQCGNIIPVETTTNEDREIHCIICGKSTNHEHSEDRSE